MWGNVVRVSVHTCAFCGKVVQSVLLNDILPCDERLDAYVQRLPHGVYEVLEGEGDRGSFRRSRRGGARGSEFRSGPIVLPLNFEKCF